jgi:hypothetical protein
VFIDKSEKLKVQSEKQKPRVRLIALAVSDFLRLRFLSLSIAIRMQGGTANRRNTATNGNSGCALGANHNGAGWGEI